MLNLHEFYLPSSRVLQIEAFFHNFFVFYIHKNMWIFDSCCLLTAYERDQTRPKSYQLLWLLNLIRTEEQAVKIGKYCVEKQAMKSVSLIIFKANWKQGLLYSVIIYSLINATDVLLLTWKLANIQGETSLEHGKSKGMEIKQTSIIHFPLNWYIMLSSKWRE